MTPTDHQTKYLPDLSVTDDLPTLNETISEQEDSVQKNSVQEHSPVLD